MDILKPQLLWIGKRCYRVNSIQNDNNYQEQQPTTNEYIEDDLYCDDENECEEEFEVVEIAPNRFKATFHVPQAFFGAIIGSKGAVKKRIEGETRTEITILKHGSSDDIKILGTKRDAVCLARRRIDLIVLNCRRKQRPTHFNCVRVMNPTIKENFIKFKEEVLGSGPTLGLEEEMFTEAEKLHLTIGVMCLMDDVDRANATELLNECLESVVMPVKNMYNGIKIHVKGVEIMNDDPSDARYLYAKIESDAMQQMADGILKRFVDAGLGKREFDRDSIKLHMTLINATSSTRDEDDDENWRNIRKKRFDARHMLEKYSQYEFGAKEIHEIQLAVMKSKDSDGFYKCTTRIQF